MWVTMAVFVIAMLVWIVPLLNQTPSQDARLALARVTLLTFWILIPVICVVVVWQWMMMRELRRDLMAGLNRIVECLPIPVIKDKNGNPPTITGCGLGVLVAALWILLKR